MVGFRPTSIARYQIFFQSSSGSNGWLFYITNANVWQYENRGGAASSFINIPAPIATTEYLALCTYNDDLNIANCYVLNRNTGIINTDLNRANIGSVTAGDGNCLIGHLDLAGYGSNAQYNLIMVWNRDFPPGEIYNILFNPYCFINPIKQRFYSIPAGGNVWAQANSDAITYAETVVKKPQKVLNDTITLAESLVKLFHKVVAQSVTVTESTVKRFFKVLSDSSTVTDTVVKRFFKTLSNSITITDTAIAGLIVPSAFIKTRYITALEKTGLFFKTGTAYVKTENESSQEDDYCVIDENIYQQLKEFGVLRITPCLKFGKQIPKLVERFDDIQLYFPFAE